MIEVFFYPSTINGPSASFIRNRFSFLPSTPVYRKCCNGTGLLTVLTTYILAFFVDPTQSANSKTFGTVALNMTIQTVSGNIIIISSHT